MEVRICVSEETCPCNISIRSGNGGKDVGKATHPSKVTNVSFILLKKPGVYGDEYEEARMSQTLQ